MKYKGRKKLTKEEAKKQYEINTIEIQTGNEQIFFWTHGKRDKLIEALCRQTTEEMIKEERKKIEYLESKREYIRQFL